MGSQTAEKESYIIVGAGAFGSSVALHIVREHPSATVTLIDKCQYPSVHAASHDWNKVVRADYVDPLYMELALEAIVAWKTDKLYKPYYHKTAVALVTKVGGALDAINENYKRLGKPDRLKTIDPGELKSSWGGAHDAADTDQIEKIIVNDDNGWAEATNTVAAVVKAAVDAGVVYHVADVQRILLDVDETARGVLCRDGTELTASRVIIAAGAMTAPILAESAPGRKDMQLGDRLVATGYAVCAVQLTPAETEALKETPVFIHSAGEVLGGVLPYAQEGKLKFYREISFKNTVHQKDTGHDITVPVYQSATTSSQLSPLMEAELWQVIRGIFGDKSRHWKLEDGHICWDALTRNKDFIICRHPCIEGLYIMTGGSFHGFKFMPVVGKYALQMIEGTLDRKYAEAWSWDSKEKPSAYPVAMPAREMRDMQ